MQSVDVYTHFMHRVKTTISFTALLSLLMLQLSGLHVHANENGYVGVPETVNSHTHTPHHNDESGHPDMGNSQHHHDYEDARDVSLFELASGDSKAPIALPAPILLFAVFDPVKTLATSRLSHRLLSDGHIRWRPPLRAPPYSANI